MKVTTLSGGKTSGYIGANYPADLYLFSLVCVDDPTCASKDKFLMQYANDKIDRHFPYYGEVIGTAEDPMIFRTMYEMEQYLGKEIIWTRGESFDQLIKRKKALPSTHKFIGRFCTTELKIRPAFEYWMIHGGEIWDFNVGYRYDEKERVSHFTTKYKYPESRNLYGKRIHRWKEIEWRRGCFPLVEDKKFTFHIQDYWQGKPVKFAEDSNCQFCIFKNKQQVKMNSINCPSQIHWAARRETKYTWHKNYSINDALSSELDLEYFYGGDAGCQAGECTN
jgi:hypothetical protein